MSGRHEGPSEAKKARDSEKAKQSGSLQDRYCEPKGATNGDAERISGGNALRAATDFFTEGCSPFGLAPERLRGFQKCRRTSASMKTLVKVTWHIQPHRSAPQTPDSAQSTGGCPCLTLSTQEHAAQLGLWSHVCDMGR